MAVHQRDDADVLPERVEEGLWRDVAVIGDVEFGHVVAMTSE